MMIVILSSIPDRLRRSSGVEFTKARRTESTAQTIHRQGLIRDQAAGPTAVDPLRSGASLPRPPPA